MVFAICEVETKMKKLFEFQRVARLLIESKSGVFNYVPERGVRYNVPIKWVRPEKKPIYHPACSEDLAPMPKLNPNSFYLEFKNSKELETANENVKKVFSLDKQVPRCTLEMYEEELVEKVRNNPYDKKSREVRIARLTARIRFYSEKIMSDPFKYRAQKVKIDLDIKKRKKLLKLLRLEDYKKFEWLLETLDLEYRPIPVPNPPVTRKKSLTLLAKLKVEQTKEEKLAALKKSYDEQKIPFLENKILKLKDIKAKEEKYNLPVTVTDADIEECMEKLEEVKIQVAERAKRGYVRKIHPYFMVPYEHDLLWEKEKEGEKIREELLNQKQTPEIPS